ncbi:MAG TPA: Asd/ArgC dimerization domain-containing protein [Candidatus Aminicenantes bacterium]|nr:Asd/ArgC dimerization domain-containing protein [Candidatus Aminicenantes bacterium]HRY65035.1 Asd/ArgC dimerization domain-containing protein [Candidatus Aminicenantes bacterium]HRZ71948.1 Asd/ArgC dimerization domain-containing protein [Candidatus Aminicenantes bacterium]
MTPPRTRKPRLAVVGSDSLRGKEILEVLTVRKFPLASLELFDPDVEEEYSKLGQFRGQAQVVHALTPAALEGLDLVFLAADEKTNLRYGRLAGRKDYLALDLSGTFNADPKVPLVVAGVNDAALRRTRTSLVANPHPATIILAHLLAGLRTGFGVEQAVAFVLEPVSAYAEEAIQELAEQSYALLGSTAMSKKVFGEQVAFNLTRPAKPDKNGFAALENRVAAEVGRVLGPEPVPLALSIVLAPVFHTYSIMVHAELGRDASAEEVEAVLGKDPLLCLPAAGDAAASPAAVAGQDRIHLGPVRKDPFLARGFWFWAVADNLTVGSSLNAYGIARALFGGD